VSVGDVTPTPAAVVVIDDELEDFVSVPVADCAKEVDDEEEAGDTDAGNVDVREMEAGNVDAIAFLLWCFEPPTPPPTAAAMITMRRMTMARMPLRVL